MIVVKEEEEDQLIFFVIVILKIKKFRLKIRKLELFFSFREWTKRSELMVTPR